MPSPALLPTDAARIAQRARRLLRAGKITHRDFCILDCLLWSCRAKGAGHAIVSYAGLAKLAHVARGTVAAAVKALASVGLITKAKRRALFPWHHGGLRSRQLANAYRFHCEFNPQPVIKSDRILSLVPAVSNYALDAARAALMARRRVSEGSMLLKR